MTRRGEEWTAVVASLIVATAVGCNGEIGGAPAIPDDLATVAPVGLRRLSRHEYDNTLRDLLADNSRPGGVLLPEDTLTPFDNDAGKQQPSLAYVEAAELVGREAAQRLVADAARRDAVLGCVPTSALDSDCMRGFVQRFGRRALRRSLAPHEITEFADLGLMIAGEAQPQDFYAGVEVVVSALLLDPAFLYRIERGGEVPGAPGFFKLHGVEIATRLSYLLLGTTPPDALLDAAEAGELDEAAGLGAMAAALLADPRAREQIDRFHALWLGYSQAALPVELAQPMRLETRLLLEQVIFDERRPWLEVFTASGSFIDDTLATHYGLALPGSNNPTWVEYGASGRAGILSHGSFLSVGGGSAETSPTKRGKLIRTRLLCGDIPPPPPDVNADEPPAGGGTCKAERYGAHSSVPACASCHRLMDPLGFGLENYDYLGRFRSAESDAPECQIAGEGEVDGAGKFHGPKGLAELLVGNDLIDACVVVQLYRYAMGRHEERSESDGIDALATAFEEGGHRFDDLLLRLVTDTTSRYRREAEEEP
jgi:hypothetical protein